MQVFGGFGHRKMVRGVCCIMRWSLGAQGEEAYLSTSYVFQCRSFIISYHIITVHTTTDYTMVSMVCVVLPSGYCAALTEACSPCLSPSVRGGTCCPTCLSIQFGYIASVYLFIHWFIHQRYHQIHQRRIWTPPSPFLYNQRSCCHEDTDPVREPRFLRLRFNYPEPDSSSHQEPTFCSGFSQSSKDLFVFPNHLDTVMHYRSRCCI